MMNNISKLLLSSVLAGCCIGIGGTVFLKVGGVEGVVGWNQLSMNIIPVYLATVAGNFVGCNIPRLAAIVNK